MKRMIKATKSNDVISGIHCIERMYGGGFGNTIFSGTKSELLSKAAKLFENYYANPEDRFIILLCRSNIGHTYWETCTSSDDFYEAEEMASDWVDPNKQPVAREAVMENHYFASIVDTVRNREIFYDNAWQRTEE